MEGNNTALETVAPGELASIAKNGNAGGGLGAQLCNRTSLLFESFNGRAIVRNAVPLCGVAVYVAFLSVNRQFNTAARPISNYSLLEQVQRQSLHTPPSFRRIKILSSPLPFVQSAVHRCNTLCLLDSVLQNRFNSTLSLHVTSPTIPPTHTCNK